MLELDANAAKGDGSMSKILIVDDDRNTGCAC